MFQNISDLEFDLTVSEVKANGAIGLSIYELLNA